MSQVNVCVQVPVPRALHWRRPRGVLQHQVQARLQELPAEGQHVHTRTQEAGGRDEAMKAELENYSY